MLAASAAEWDEVLALLVSDNSLTELVAASGLAPDFGFSSADAMLAGMQIQPVVMLQPLAPAAAVGSDGGSSLGAIVGGSVGALACVVLVLSQSGRRRHVGKAAAATMPPQPLNLRAVSIYAGDFAAEAAAAASPRRRARSPQPARTAAARAASPRSALTPARRGSAAATASLRAATPRSSPRLQSAGGARVGLAVAIRELPASTFFMRVWAEGPPLPASAPFLPPPPFFSSTSRCTMNYRLRSKGALSAAGEVLKAVPLTEQEAGKIASPLLRDRLRAQNY